ncbi:MAG: hypothetical protein LBS69_11790 [Prevotellaceae bacterium]|jgi:hypothetical protein|nr:hypothetical protein [Prevotellaceae bacterium]
MKKFLVILIAVIGFGISANAQICQITKGVEPTFEKSGTQLYIKLVNTNDYKVTVDVTAKIVLKKDGSKKEVKRTVVIDIDNKSTVVEEHKKNITTSIKYDDVDIDASSVTLVVSKCS